MTEHNSAKKTQRGEVPLSISLSMISFVGVFAGVIAATSGPSRNGYMLIFALFYASVFGAMFTWLAGRILGVLWSPRFKIVPRHEGKSLAIFLVGWLAAIVLVSAMAGKLFETLIG